MRKKIDFTIRVKKSKDRINISLNNRLDKIITETVKVIIKKGHKRLTAEDYKEICKCVYNKLDSKSYMGIYKVVNNEVVKDKISDSLIQYYLTQGVDVNKKLIELTNKSETLIKSTNDALNVAKFYKELIDEDRNKQTKITEKHTFNSFDSYKLNKPLSKDSKGMAGLSHNYWIKAE